MEIDEDDDIYVPEEPKVENEEPKPKAEDLEEGEEEDSAMDEDSDDDSVRCAA